jgi:hypothetical protein
MNRWIVFALAVCLTASCDDGPTSPSDSPFVFTTVLRPANEVPPVANAESGGTGTVQITILAARDAGGSTSGGTADIIFQLSGFPGPLTIVGAHIHPGVAGVNGGVVVSTGLTAGGPTVFPNGTGEFRASGIPVNAATLQSLVDNASAFYFNVHSPLNPGGFARGQLARVQ